MGDEIQVVLDVSYVQYYKCTKTAGCRYECRNKWKLDRHEKTCTKDSQFRYKQKCYGNHESARNQLISLGVINREDKTHQRFVSFDIESVSCTEDARSFGCSYSYGTQRVISIGYSASFGDFKAVLTRIDMTRENGLNLIREFLKKMNELQLRHYERIPDAIKEALFEYKELIKQGNLSVLEKTAVVQRLYYLKSLCDLKVIGFNSSGYDLPCLFNLIVEVVGPSKVKVIKKGNSIFDMRIDQLCFRDCMNYCGPISLAKFAKIFNLPIAKSIFPYEYFGSIQEIRDQKTWPNYSAFASSLPKKCQNYLTEVGSILQQKEKYNIATLEELFNEFEFPCESYSAQTLTSTFLPELSISQQASIKQYFAISPIDYLNQKIAFSDSISSSRYKNFESYLVEYNLLDCDLLTQSLIKFIEVFDRCFNVSLLDKMSLPGISEEIMWSFYDDTCPKMYSFDNKYGFLNKQIREKLMGGPTIVFHRHCEIQRSGSHHDSVHTTPNGDKYTRLVSYDFNALYAYAMKENLPTGLPFYYKQKKCGNFSFEIAASPAGWSLDALDWLNFMSYDARFMKSDGSFYFMQSAITGEYTITTKFGKYAVDGMVNTGDVIYLLEYLGCRYGDT